MRIRLIHERLIELVQSSSISQNHWAMRLGISRGHFSDLLHGKYPYPSRRTQERLLEVFRAQFDDLFILEEEQDEWTVGSRADFQAAIASSFLIDQELGRGGMGTVYLARDVKHGRRVAIKVMSPEVVSGIGAANFLREIRRTASLDHHHILTLIDSGIAAGYPYYVMPFVSGGSLRSRLDAQGPLSLTETSSVVSGIAKALRHAHHQHVVHCDIKPENILFSEDHAYVADFGIARTIHAESRAWKRAGELDASAGTPAYVSPEQVLGEQLDGRSDIYSLGCVAFEMLAGAAPFEGRTTMHTVTKRFIGRVPDLRDYAAGVPAAVASVIRRAMDLDPGKRFSSVDAFASALHHATEETDTMGYRVRSFLDNTTYRLRTATGGRLRRRTRWMEYTFDHMAFAFRMIKRNPAFTVAAALTLALGIGSNATMLGILDYLLFRPIPHVNQEDLHRIYLSQRFGGNRTVASALSWPDIEDLRSNEHFDAVAAQFPSTLTMNRGDGARRVSVNMITPSYFDLLGIRPFLGRFFRPEENTGFGEPSVAVLTHAAWRRIFAEDEAVLGTEVSLGSGRYTIVGITPPRFSGIDLRSVDMFVPVRSAANENIGGPWETSRGIRWLRGIVRLDSTSTIPQAEVAASERYRLGNRDRPSYDPEARIIVGPLMEASGPRASTDSRVARWLVGVSALVLLIACANVANLLLARSARRKRELSIRLALGVSRARLITQLLTESIVLAVVAGLGAALLSSWGSSAVNAILLPNLEWNATVLDPRLMVITMAIVLTAGIGTGVIPAVLSTRADLITELRSGPRTGSRKRSSIQSGLLVTQTALSAVLLIGAGLFVSSLRNVRNHDLGYDLDRVIVVTADHNEQFGVAEAAQFYTNAEEILGSLPGVTATGQSNSVPFRTNWAVRVEIPGIDTIPTTGAGGPYVVAASHGLTQTMGYRILRGRSFTEADRAGTEPVVVVSETMARLVWRGEDPLGRCMVVGSVGSPCATIIGVAQDASQQILTETGTMVFYVLLDQYPEDVDPSALFVRADDPRSMVATIRQTLATIAPQPPFVDVDVLETYAAPQFRPWRLGATMFSLFGILALVVAAVGLYSVVSFDVAQRRHEIGVRTALGATTSRLMTHVLQHTIRIAGLGVVLGSGVALLAGSAIRPLLYGIDPVRIPSYVTTVIVLLSSAIVAALIPAWRAASVQPVEALRLD